MPPTLRTPRLLLDAYTPADEESFVALFQDPRVSGHEIVYALTPGVWGGGLGTELAEALVAYGFETLVLTEVHATVDARNTASLRLLGRAGFEHTRDVVEDDGGITRVLTRRLPRSPAS